MEKSSVQLMWLTWQKIDGSLIPKNNQLVILKGKSGNIFNPEFIMTGYYDPERHPKARSHWFDCQGEHLSDSGLEVEFWSPLQVFNMQPA